MDLSHNLIKFKALNRSIGFGVCVCVVGVCFTLRCSMREEQRALPLVCGACGCPPANPHIHSGSYFVRHLQPRSSSNNSPHPVVASLIRSRATPPRPLTPQPLTGDPHWCLDARQGGLCASQGHTEAPLLNSARRGGRRVKTRVGSVKDTATAFGEGEGEGGRQKKLKLGWQNRGRQYFKQGPG